MTNEDAERLIERYLAGKCSPEEIAWVEEAYRMQAESAEVATDSVRREAVKADVRHYLRRYVRDGRVGQQAPKVVRGIRRWIAAAAVVLVGATAAWFFRGDRINSEPTIATLESADIAPAGNRATLTLAEGRTIDLNEAQTGIIIGDEISYNDGSQVIANEQLTIDSGGQQGTINYQRSTINSLTTPKGGTYQVKLSDGTVVWLNAGSTLHYPNRFSKNERVVEFEGEGYFSIAKDPNRPFKVISKGQEINVLGTEFNLSAYGDEPMVKTTLVKGSVRVASTANSVILASGEQSSMSSEGRLSKGPVNIKKELAWKSGLFYFEGTSFEELLRQVGRWYDVDIRYEGRVPQESFSGIMSRNVTLTTLLNYLRESAEVEFTLEGHVVYVFTKQ